MDPIYARTSISGEIPATAGTGTPPPISVSFAGPLTKNIGTIGVPSGRDVTMIITGAGGGGGSGSGGVGGSGGGGGGGAMIVIPHAVWDIGGVLTLSDGADGGPAGGSTGDDAGDSTLVISAVTRVNAGGGFGGQSDGSSANGGAVSVDASVTKLLAIVGQPSAVTATTAGSVGGTGGGVGAAPGGPGGTGTPGNGGVGIVGGGGGGGGKDTTGAGGKGGAASCSVSW